MIKIKNRRVELSGTKKEIFLELCNAIIAFSDVFNFDSAKVGCDITNAVIKMEEIGISSDGKYVN